MSFLLTTSSARAGGQAVSFVSLLEEMLDRSAVARWPDPEYRALQASSWDRRSAVDGRPNPDQSDEGWFANRDWGQYLRTEQRNGRTEKVLMEAQGPGAIVRIWSANPDLGGTLRIYLDGSDEPVIEESFRKLTDGTGSVAPPLSAVRARGHNLYLPIPYAEGCRITLDGDPENRVYYIVNYRSYAQGTAVDTFRPDDLQAHAARMRDVGRQLEAPPAMSQEASAGRRARSRSGGPLPPGSLAETRLADDGGALRELVLTLDLENLDSLEEAARQLVLEVFADDERTIHVPVGDFFGSGLDVNASRDRYRSVRMEGTKAVMTSTFVMPFERTLRLRLSNRGSQPVSYELSVAAGDWDWDDRSMHFRANYRQERGIPTRPRRDWTYLTAEGKGLYVGDTLVVTNPTPIWWGEGDEKIYVDREEFPSHFGTGTEDYYGYAWSSWELFEAPFHGQPRADGPQNFGHITNSRVRALDAIPFNEHFHFDMEIWHWQDVVVDYAVTTFWYARPGAKVPMPDPGAEMDLSVPSLPHMKRLENVIEAESLQVAGRSEDLQVTRQMMIGVFPGDWSGGTHLWVRATAVGQHVDLVLPTPEEGPTELTVWLTRAPDYGQVQLYVDGREIGPVIDLYAPQVEPAEPVTLGTFTPAGPETTLRLEIVGANAAARPPGTYAGVDALRLSPAE